MKQVAVFNDIAGIAACTLGVSLPILSVCDCKVYPMPTAVFSASTRVEGFCNTSLSAFLPEVARHWKSLDLHLDAVLTGCFGDADGALSVKGIVHELRANGALVMVDPVMGDEGFVFAPSALQDAMRQLVHEADIICPNFTEFCVLCGADYARLEQADKEEKWAFFLENVASLGVDRVVVTGVRQGDEVSNFVYDKGETAIFVHSFHSHGVCGTGDMFSNIVLARVLYGCSLLESVQFACQWIMDLAKEMPEHAETGLYIGGKRLLALRQGILE